MMLPTYIIRDESVSLPTDGIISRVFMRVHGLYFRKQNDFISHNDLEYKLLTFEELDQIKSSQNVFQPHQTINISQTFQANIFDPVDESSKLNCLTLEENIECPKVNFVRLKNKLKIPSSSFVYVPVRINSKVTGNFFFKPEREHIRSWDIALTSSLHTLKSRLRRRIEPWSKYKYYSRRSIFQ